MIVLMNGEKMMYNVLRIPEVAWQIDYPKNHTTHNLDKPRNVAPNLVSGDNSLGIVNEAAHEKRTKTLTTFLSRYN
jgi:L-threonylcarbamoyladenylate synthase